MTIGLLIAGSMTSCNKKDDVVPEKKSGTKTIDDSGKPNPDYCPACGMG